MNGDKQCVRLCATKENESCTNKQYSTKNTGHICRTKIKNEHDRDKYNFSMFELKTIQATSQNRADLPQPASLTYNLPPADTRLLSATLSINQSSM